MERARAPDAPGCAGRTRPEAGLRQPDTPHPLTFTQPQHLEAPGFRRMTLRSQYRRVFQRLPSGAERLGRPAGHDNGIDSAGRPSGVGLVAVTGDRMSSQPGATIWFTGLPSSGRSTIARDVYQRLLDRSLPEELLDGLAQEEMK